jgi:hypothetical protein
MKFSDQITEFFTSTSSIGLFALSLIFLAMADMQVQYEKGFVFWLDIAIGFSIAMLGFLSTVKKLSNSLDSPY